MQIIKADWVRVKLDLFISKCIIYLFCIKSEVNLKVKPSLDFDFNIFLFIHFYSLEFRTLF